MFKYKERMLEKMVRYMRLETLGWIIVLHLILWKSWFTIQKRREKKKMCIYNKTWKRFNTQWAGRI